MNKSPRSHPIQAFAEFWDTHDLTDFQDQLEEVADPIFVRDNLVQIHLQPVEAEAIKQVAQPMEIDNFWLFLSQTLEQLVGKAATEGYDRAEDHDWLR